ncbi:MAG: ATP-binding protein, partial [Eubacterium sp.]|nr:ATP-binding protein [Eubacterium sp.]
FNPVLMKDPDTTLSTMEREIGGLGIFMVKNTMEDVSYEYNEGKNTLRFKKSWERK